MAAGRSDRSTSESGETPVVTHDPDRHRYVISVDGVPLGTSVYSQTGDLTIFVHTEIAPAGEGRGLGSVLVREALDDIAEHDGRIVALCPFVSGWIERHPEYERLVDEQMTAAYRRS